jgi:hypothetical protein
LLQLRGAPGGGSFGAVSRTAAALEEWWARIDGDATGDPAELLAEDVRFSLTSAGKTNVGGRDELMAYVHNRIAEGRRHHILMSCVTGNSEIVAGELREHGRPIASFIGAAERNAEGCIKRYLITSSSEMLFAFPGSIGV